MKKRNPYDILLAPELETYTGKKFTENKYADRLFDNQSILLDTQIEFNGVVFERCTFSGDFRKAQFIDCVLNRCDLSNTDFQSSRYHRVKLSSCKGLGIHFNKAKWQYVTIEDSVLNYGEFADVDFQDIVLTKSDLSQSSFFTAKLQRMTMKQVDLTQSDFSDTMLAGLDFSFCEIGGIRVSPQCLKGLRVNTAQAIALIGLFGVEVSD
ncbi:MAG: pentapeptide repeat-containing protein [Erysipelotrichaceae bacterium]